jgi:hypothetical protein
VHAGATLELLLDDGHWLRIRYEWSWRADELPRGYATLGVPAPAEEVTDSPLVSFELPARAILRWPALPS